LYAKVYSSLEKLLTVKELAYYLRVKPITIYRKAKAGEIPAVKIGKGWRFSSADIESWLKEKKVSKK